MLVFLKLGGSLITVKSRPHTVRLKTLTRLADEIVAAKETNTSLRLVIGHGSGSFGHVAGQKHKTRDGVFSNTGWLGFAEVWKEARVLNQIVLEALLKTGLPVIAFPPSACALANNKQISDWEIEPIQTALDNGIVPLVNGDVVFDKVCGGTIVSTEDAFVYLSHRLKPERILLAGIEQGIWADYPVCKRFIEKITPAIYKRVNVQIGASHNIDVTGGMANKVESMLNLIQEQPNLQVLIFSGNIPGQLYQALSGASPGTILLDEQEKLNV